MKVSQSYDDATPAVKKVYPLHNAYAKEDQFVEEAPKTCCGSFSLRIEDESRFSMQLAELLPAWTSRSTRTARSHLVVL